MTKGPLVLKVPPIPDRYYVFQFMDAFANVFTYVGARTTGSTGGTYLITGPNWSGQVPTGITEIKTPTNLAWISNRILVKGPSDLPNVHAIQDQVRKGDFTSIIVTLPNMYIKCIKTPGDDSCCRY